MIPLARPYKNRPNILPGLKSVLLVGVDGAVGVVGETIFINALGSSVGIEGVVLPVLGVLELAPLPLRSGAMVDA